MGVDGEFADVIEVERVVEQPDEQADRARSVVVLRLGEEEWLRLSKPRRFASLPSVAPTTLPPVVRVRTISDSWPSTLTGGM